MKVIRYSCPICYKEFDTNPKTCDVCGFEGIEKYIYDFEDKEANLKFLNNELFNIYKYTKNVYFGRIPFRHDNLDIIDDKCNDKTYVMGAEGSRGVAIVDLHNDVKPVVADEGILAFDQTKALILNTDEVKSLVLDESQVRILFLGPDVKLLTSGYLGIGYLKYIFVDPANKFFSSDNNVLFNKNKTELIMYAKLKNEEEYTVPSTVKIIGKGAFRGVRKLKTLYIPKNTKLPRGTNSINSDEPDFKIIRY